MALSNDITECPNCGSKESYNYIVTQKYIQVRGFTSDEYDHCDEDKGVDHHGACRCDNCGKIIKRRE